MPEPANQPAQLCDGRGRQIYVWWAVALTLLALLGVFCWAVVLPVWQVSTVIPAMFVDECLPVHKLCNQLDEINAAIERLGGRNAARRKLVTYYRVMPEFLNPNPSPDTSPACQEEFLMSMTILLLGHVDEPPVPLLAQALQARNASARCAAVLALGRIGPAAGEAVPALQALLKHEGKGEGGGLMKRLISDALKRIKPAEATEPQSTDPPSRG